MRTAKLGKDALMVQVPSTSIVVTVTDDIHESDALRKDARSFRDEIMQVCTDLITDWSVQWEYSEWLLSMQRRRRG